MAEAIDKELSGYIAHLTLPQKKSLLAVIKSFLKEKSDQSVDLNLYNKEIDEAMARMNDGSFISHEDLEKEAAKW